MSNSRKDMWKLLYNLVSRKESDLNVFAFVHEILCKETSLIQNYSLREQDNIFQDTFILWLINKFLIYYGEQSNNENVEVQKQIVSSCLVNRPFLYENLCRAYIKAIQEITSQIAVASNDDYNDDDAGDESYITITSFIPNDNCLLQIDENFNNQPIRFQLHQSDEYVQICLKVLHHGLAIGYDMYPALYATSFQGVLQAIKECDITTKLLALQYYNSLFEANYEMNPAIEYFYQQTVNAILLMLEQMHMWMEADIIEPHEFNEFIDTIVSILKSNDRLRTDQLQRNQHQYLNSLTTMLVNCLDLGPLLPQKFNQMKLITLYHMLLDTILKVELKMYINGTIAFALPHTTVFMNRVDRHPELMRLLATKVITYKDTHFETEIMEFFQRKLLQFLDTKIQKQYENMHTLSEIVQSLAFVEQCQCRESQLKHLKTLQEKTTQFNNLNADWNVRDTQTLHTFNNDQFKFDFNKKIRKLLDDTKGVAIQENCLKLFGLLLTPKTLLNSLDISLWNQIVTQLAEPLKSFSSKINYESNADDAVCLSFRILCNLNINIRNETIAKTLKEFIQPVGFKIFNRKIAVKLRQEYTRQMGKLIVGQLIGHEQLVTHYIVPSMDNADLFAALLKSFLCTLKANSFRPFVSVQCLTSSAEPIDQAMTLMCSQCNTECQTLNDVVKYVATNFVYIKCTKFVCNPTPTQRNTILPLHLKEFLASCICQDKNFAFVANHLDQIQLDPEKCFVFISEMQSFTSLEQKNLTKMLTMLIRHDDEKFIKRIAVHILGIVLKSLTLGWPHAEQLKILQIICECSSLLTEQWFFHFFKMTFFYLLHPNSLIVHESVHFATQMCKQYSVQPIQLWNWYKRDALSLIVKLVVYVFLSKGVRINKSLKAFSKTLGFSCAEEFICKYYRLLTTMILPYCVKEPHCKGLIMNISKINRKSIPTLFVVSFLRIYTHIYLTEEALVGNKCIDLIVKCTACSLNKLMNTDVKQTVAEFLFYFNRDANFVMRAFQCLLRQENNRIESTPTNVFAKFIADRFLGVITYFETCLAEPHFEKSLKEEALYSLGQIIRFVGSQPVTQFRFKIIAMLSFVLTLDDNKLQSICLKIWNIFLHIVNIQELGPSLSRIVASLLPLLEKHKQDINDICEFVITRNDSLLGVHISDLYFLEHVEHVAPCIKQCVARQTDMLKCNKTGLVEKLAFFHKQIGNENLQVRIYGLRTLKNFISANRSEINRLILREIRVNPQLENIVDILLAGCRHEDANLNLESAKCLGELGGVDPSYMPSNYSFERSVQLPLSVLTDDFAIMALTELCRAHQFQKDTKYVDCFSLAIQETLSVCGVSPKHNKKMNVWEAIPQRMRQVMEPLLNSCYTGSRRESKCKEHPIFNSSFCRSYQDWAYAWASRIIDYVQNDDTKHLLNSYKPSIRRDNNTLGVLMPYMLLHSLQDCNEQQANQVHEEFVSVFSYGSGSAANQQSDRIDSVVGIKEFQSTKYSADRNTKSNPTESFEAMENITRNCTKLCSELVDFLQSWQREWQRINNLSKNEEGAARNNSKRIKNFLNAFDKVMIAKANYRTGEYARALMYLEQYIEMENVEERLQEQISFLIEIHGKLLDSDSVEGAVYIKKSNLNLAEEILVNRIVDRPQETMSCYEQLISSKEQINPEHIKGIIDCYLRMDTPETALLITDGLWQKLADQYTDDYFKECKSELLWRLGRYDELEELLEDPVVRRKTTNWNIQCAESFLLLRDQSRDSEWFDTRLDVIRSNILSTMRSTNSGVNHNSYTHSYDDIIKLHLMNEVEKVRKLNHSILNKHLTAGGLDFDLIRDDLQTFFLDFDARLCVLQPTVRVMEPILSFRRNLLIESKIYLRQPGLAVTPGAEATLKNICQSIDVEIGKLWLRSVQMNRDAGSLQQAHLSIMKAEQYAPQSLFIEKSKLLWEKGDQSHSFKLLEENLERIETKCEQNIRNLDDVDRALYTEAKFLQATYNAESMNICSELNVRYFKDAISGNRQSEKCYVHLAQYMEKIYDSYSKEQKESDIGQRLLLDLMFNYAKSLRYGFEYIYQSLPRLLSFWLDTTSECVLIAETSSNDPAVSARILAYRSLSDRMNELVKNCVTVLPTSVFYTAFSQLLSRICHPSNDVYNVLRSIVIKLIEKFPHQSLWMLLPVLKSSHTNRIKRCKMIFTDARLDNHGFQKLLNDFNMLAERLIELTNKEVSSDQKYELSALVKQLPKLFQDANFSQILLPFEKYMQASFPITSSYALSTPLSMSDSSQERTSTPTNPFPYAQIFITSVKEQVTVLRSAAKPKKITILCNDGKQYEVMVKPKDDLRKDFRLMEFNGLLKRYLHQDSQARHRRLRIRTYAAIPFNDECGLVEWLPKLSTFRSICTSIYSMRGLGIPDRSLRQCIVPKPDPIEKKRSVFLKMLLPRHPPVFQDWFRQIFSTPHSWYEARSSYVKTVAVMSMVGYILGLGDRHGENILFDETNGDAVHVDFNCLFNRGECFAYPEVVPFRLTHNMVFAMGPLGTEGLYRKCCEITLRVLKRESKTLLSVLRPFVYDLVVLNRNYNKKPTSAELTDPKAMMDVRRIEERLRGHVKKSMPLSTEGQVNFLITEATNIDNLASMYIGWGAYI